MDMGEELRKIVEMAGGLPDNPDRVERYVKALSDAKEVVERAYGLGGDSAVKGMIVTVLTALFGMERPRAPMMPPAFSLPLPVAMPAICPHLKNPRIVEKNYDGDCMVNPDMGVCTALHLAVHGNYRDCLHYKMSEVLSYGEERQQ